MIKLEYWKDKIWDDGLTLKLLVKFMKEHHCMHRIYTRTFKLLPRYYWSKLYYPMTYNVGGFFLRYGKDIRRCQENEGMTIVDDLVLSQLWKFYVLERIEMYPQPYRTELKETLTFQIRNNGYRGDEEVKRLFEIHNLRSKKD